MSDELKLFEPLDPELALLFAADKAVEDGVSAAMQTRIHAAVLAHTRAGAAALAAGAASPSLWSAKVALVTTAAFVAGGGAGAALHASLSEVRVIERRVEVSVPVVIPENAGAAADAAVALSDAGISLAPPPTPHRIGERAIEEPHGVAAERRLLDAALAARARGRALDALAALRRHHDRFENGQLAEERDALRIEILIADGQHSRARAELAHFEASYPRSVHRSRLVRLMERLPEP